MVKMRDEKRLARMRVSRNSVSPEELETVLLDWGFVPNPGHGSHRVFRHPALAEKISIPYRRPLKPAYVRLALAAIDRVRRLEREDE
jgi:predicted RNA binding protein YcfA (HicA-like mRNA interferase family)